MILDLLMKKNAWDRWILRLAWPVFFGAAYLTWFFFFNPASGSPRAEAALVRINMLLGGIWALYALYYLVWQKRYTTMPEYRAMKRHGDPERMIGRIEEDLRGKREAFRHAQNSRLFVMTHDYVFATQRYGGGYARLEDLVCCTYTLESKGMAELYLWAKNKPDSIIFYMPQQMAEEISDYLFTNSPAMIGYDPKLKVLRLFNYGAYKKRCLSEGRKQRENGC